MDILEDKVEPIIVEGFIDPTEERAKIRAQEIYSLGQLRINSSVHISLDEVNSTPDNMNKLKEIFNEYPGPSKIILHIRSNGEIADVEVGNCTVDLGDKFIKSIEKSESTLKDVSEPDYFHFRRLWRCFRLRFDLFWEL